MTAQARLDATLKSLSDGCGGTPMKVENDRYYVNNCGCWIYGYDSAQLRRVAARHEFPGGMKGLADEERAVADAMDAVALERAEGAVAAERGAS